MKLFGKRTVDPEARQESINNFKAEKESLTHELATLSELVAGETDAIIEASLGDEAAGQKVTEIKAAKIRITEIKDRLGIIDQIIARAHTMYHEDRIQQFIKNAENLKPELLKATADVVAALQALKPTLVHLLDTHHKIENECVNQIYGDKFQLQKGNPLKDVNVYLPDERALAEDIGFLYDWFVRRSDYDGRIGFDSYIETVEKMGVKVKGKK